MSGSLMGRVRVSPSRPSAAAECDRCSQWWRLDDLRPQKVWAGVKLMDTGFLVCPPCLDIPNEQMRSIILPADPYPRRNPRPSRQVTPIAYPGGPVPTTPENQGFSQYVIGGTSIWGFYPAPNPGGGATLTDEYGNPITDEYGTPIALEASSPLDSPIQKAQLLALVAAMSGVPTPSQVFDRSVILTPQNSSIELMQAQPARGWLLLYGPVVPVAQIAKAASITWGAVTNLSVGGGEALFWATDQDVGTVWQGAVAVAGLYPGLEFWAFESPGGTNLVLTDENGVPITDEYGYWIPLG